MTPCTPLLVILACFLLGTTTSATEAPAGAFPAGVAAAPIPTRPAAACLSQQVHSALRECAADGLSHHCCSSLSDVYANSSSPAYGCLCLPGALLHTLLAAAEQRVDMLGLLRHCNAHHHDFTVQWAGAIGSQCPDFSTASSLSSNSEPHSPGPVEMAMRQGPARILVTNRPFWAWGNLQQGREFVQQIGHMEAFAEHLAGRQLLKLSLLVLLSLPLLFVVLHHGVLRPWIPTYRALSMPQQLVSCQHAVFLLVFGVSLIPQTTLACRLLFGAWTGDIVTSRLWTQLLAFTMSRAGLYLVEACVRTVKWSWVLVAHHVIFLTMLTLGIWSGNVATGVISAVLDLFACHEAPLYAALLAYRLRAPLCLARAVTRGACFWYALTRVFQTAILAYMMTDLATVPGVKDTAEFILTAGMCISLTAIQAYTLIIYAAIDKKILRRHTADAQHVAVAAKLKKAGEFHTLGEDDAPLLEPADSIGAVHTGFDISSSTPMRFRRGRQP